MWAPVFNDEWEGDVYLGAGDKSKETETTTGKVVFKGECQLLDQFRARMSRDPYDGARQECTHERSIV